MPVAVADPGGGSSRPPPHFRENTWQSLTSELEFQSKR